MAANDRIKIDEGEIRYTFGCIQPTGRDTTPLIRVTFRGPRLGTEFDMEIDDARRMRADLGEAIKTFERLFRGT